MKTLITIIIFGTVFFSFCSLKKGKIEKTYFEGKIVYKLQFIIKSNTERARLFSKLYPETTTYYFKEGNILEKYDKGEDMQTWYLKDETKFVKQRWNNDTLYSFDCSGPGEKVLNHAIVPMKDSILGIPCNELKMYYDNKVNSYYYSPDSLKITPEWFQKFTYINRHLTSNLTKSIFLKTTIERPDYMIVSTAISITHETLDDSIFKIPPNAIIVEEK